MHGLGNDFIVINGIEHQIELQPEQIRKLAHRRFGIGCDQLLLLESSRDPRADFRYRIFNADGNEVEQCGNGARCCAHFIRHEGLSSKNPLRVKTLSGIIELIIQSDEQVTVNMGEPVFDPPRIPFITNTQSVVYQVEAEGRTFELSAVSLGNPHAVMLTDNLDTAAVAHIGAMIESHERFPQRVNVGFMQIMDSRHIRLRVYERGVGETLACGSGACAAVVTGRIRGLLDDQPISVDLPGGRLVISWGHKQDSVMMTGPANYVYKGSIEL